MKIETNEKDKNKPNKNKLEIDFGFAKWDLEPEKLGLLSDVDLRELLSLLLSGAYGAALSPLIPTTPLGGAGSGIMAAASVYSIIEYIRHYLISKLEPAKWLEEKQGYVDSAADIANMLESQWSQTILKGPANPDEVAYEWFKNHKEFMPGAIGTFRAAVTSKDYKINDLLENAYNPARPSLSLYSEEDVKQIIYEAIKNTEDFELRDRLYRWLPSIIKAHKRIAEEEKQKKIGNVKIDGLKTSDNASRPFSDIDDIDINEFDLEKSYSLPSGGGIGEFSFSLLPDNYGMTDDIMSSLNIPVDFSSLLGESSAFNLPETLLLPSSGIQGGSGGQSVGAGFSLFPESVGSLDSLFGMGGGISIPVQYEIEVKGLEQFESIKEKAEEAGEAVEESRDTFSNFSSEMMKQFLNLKEEQRAALSVDMAMMPLNIMGIGGAPFQFSMPVEESKEFSETLSDIAGIAGQLGGAFMNVNENIGKAIGSVGGFAGGISNVLSALKMNPLEGKDISKMTPEQIESAREQGEKRKGLALMGGIQGAFAGLQGLFGGEPGSDTSQLLGGFGGGMVKFQRIIYMESSLNVVNLYA